MVGARDEHDGAQKEEFVRVPDAKLEELEEGLAEEEGAADEEEDGLKREVRVSLQSGSFCTGSSA